MKLRELKKEIKRMLKDKPSYLRDGQAVFNYMDRRYGVARTVQFEDGVDCFYSDKMIDEFLEVCIKYINEK